MKFPKKINLLLLTFILLNTSFLYKSLAQEYHLSNEQSELKVYGTSSLHDWHIVTEEQKGYVIVDQGTDFFIKKLDMEAVSESLKSGKNGMDKNTYKALNTKKYKTIRFQLSETKNITKLNDNNYNVESFGKLKIAGVTKIIALKFALNLGNNQVCLKGEKTLKMTDFGIEPPKALFGTITTGDEITIKFNTILKKQ